MPGNPSPNSPPPGRSPQKLPSSREEGPGVEGKNTIQPIMKYKSAESDSEKLTTLRRELRNHSTAAEATLWKFLKNSQVGGYKFRRQHSIGPFVLDFYCPLLRLGIELDGEVHHAPMVDVKDELRTKFLNEQGITVLRFENEVVWRNPQGIVDEIIEFGRRYKRL